MASGIQFPKEIGPANREGYEDGYEESRSETPMDIGPPRRRNLYSVTPRLFQVSWDMKPFQYSIFEIWWQESIGAGVREFDIQLLDRNEQLRWFTCTFHEARFTASIVEGQKWTVTAKLRSIGASFAVRLPITDQLHGVARFGFSSKAFLPKPIILYGKAKFGFKPRRASIARADLNAKATFGFRRAFGALED